MDAPSPNPFAKNAARELTGHKKKIWCLAWSPNGKKLASGSADSTIRIWALEPYQVSKVERAESELKGHSDYVAAIDWKPTSSDVLASISSSEKDKSVRFWDVRSGKCASTVSMSTSGSVCLAWSPDGHHLAVANNAKECSIAFVDVRKNKVLKTHRVQTEVYRMHWGPTLSQLMLATSDGTVDIHSLPDMSVLWSLKGHTYSCYSLAIDKAHKVLASGGGDALVSLWDLTSMACVRTLTRMDGAIRDMSITRDGNYVAYAAEPLPSVDTSVSNNKGGVVEIASVKTGELMSAYTTRGAVQSVAWNPEHPVLAYTEEREESDGRGGRTVLGSIIIQSPPAK